MPANAVLLPIGLEAFAQTVGALRGSPLAQREAYAERPLQAPVLFSAFELHVDERAVARGRMAIEGDRVGLCSVFTAPAARGQGWARTLCTELLKQARPLAARHASLRVGAGNHAARAVDHRLGFEHGYAYRYRTRDPAAA